MRRLRSRQSAAIPCATTSSKKGPRPVSVSSLTAWPLPASSRRSVAQWRSAPPVPMSGATNRSRISGGRPAMHGEDLAGSRAREVGAVGEEARGLGLGLLARIGSPRRGRTRGGRGGRRPRRVASPAGLRSRPSGDPAPSRSGAPGTGAARRPRGGSNAVTGPISTKRVSRTSEAGRRRVTFQAEWLRSVCAGCARSRPNASQTATNRSRNASGSSTSSSTTSSQSAPPPAGRVQHSVQVLELPARQVRRHRLLSERGLSAADRSQRDAHVVAL